MTIFVYLLDEKGMMFMHELLTERPDLFEPNNQMSFYLTLNKVDENKLKDSIYKTYLLHEVMHSKVIFEKEKAYYIKQEQTNNKVFITNEDFLNILKREEKKQNIRDIFDSKMVYFLQLN